MSPQDLSKRLQDVKRLADEGLAAATTPDHKLLVLANYGDIALKLLTPAASAIDELVADSREACTYSRCPREG